MKKQQSVTNQPDFENLSFEDAVAWLEKHSDELEWHEAQAEVSESLSSVVSVRFKGAELDAVTNAAQQAGTSLSAFIRESAIRAANSAAGTAKTTSRVPAAFHLFLDQAARAFLKNFAKAEVGKTGEKPRKSSERSSQSGSYKSTATAVNTVNGARLERLKKERQSGQRGGKPRRRATAD